MAEAEPIPRDEAARRLEHYLKRDAFPRLTVMALLMITGLAGFLAAAGMLHLGLNRMWIRYPLAVAAAYGVFIGLIRLWAEFERRRLATADALDELEPEPKKTSFADVDDGSWLDWSDLVAPDLDAASVPYMALAAAVVVVMAILGVVFAAPALLAEVLLDVILVGALYHRVRRIAQQHWFVTIIARTWGAALVAALVLSLTGGIIQAFRPDVRSIGQVWTQQTSRPVGGG